MRAKQGATSEQSVTQLSFQFNTTLAMSKPESVILHVCNMLVLDGVMLSYYNE